MEFGIQSDALSRLDATGVGLGGIGFPVVSIEGAVGQPEGARKQNQRAVHFFPILISDPLESSPLTWSTR